MVNLLPQLLGRSSIDSGRHRRPVYPQGSQDADYDRKDVTLDRPRFALLGELYPRPQKGSLSHPVESDVDSTCGQSHLSKRKVHFRLSLAVDS